MRRYYEFKSADRHELLARNLEGHDDYRILRRLPAYEELWLTPTPRTGATVMGVVDCETTGLDADRDKLIELAIVKMTLDEQGMLADMPPPIAWLEDPGFALPENIERITGLNDADLQGQSFNDEEIMLAFDNIDVLVSHNAPFDRSFLVRRFPQLGHPWGCSAREIAWAEVGLEGRALGHLLASAGHFFAAHRAGPDAWALGCLLAMQAPDGRPIATHLIETARKTTMRLYARDAPFSVKDALKAAGYRWDARLRCWWLEGDDERIANEQVFLQTLHPLIKPQIEEIDWFTRHVT